MRNFGKKSLDEMKERLRMRGFILPEAESDLSETEPDGAADVDDDAEAPFDGDEEA
jgi:DNA-directed RNA polymerase alpha subunit